MSDAVDLALDAVERTPEHELRRLLQRLAVSDPFVIKHGVEKMNTFDQLRRTNQPRRITR